MNAVSLPQWCRRARAAAGVGLAGFASTAHAHSSIPGIGDFYAGMLHPITAPEHALPFFAIGVLAGQRGSAAQVTPLVFAVAVMLGALAALWLPALPWVAFVNITSAVFLGGLIAAAWRAPLALYVVLAVGFGLTHGYANGTAAEPPIKPWVFIPGVGLSALLASGWAMAVTDFLVRHRMDWLKIAVRVLGSWIAAIGILVLATSWKALTRA